MAEKRKFNRVQTINLLSYVALDEYGNPLDQGKGETLDISQEGLKMLTKTPIEVKYVLLMTVDLNNELIKIKGMVVYCLPKIPGAYHIGIRFVENNEKIRAIIVDMIKVFNRQKRIKKVGLSTQYQNPQKR